MKIHLAREGLRMGPFTLEQTNRRLASGEVLPTDLAWREGLTQWISLGQIEGIIVPSPDLPAAENDSRMVEEERGVYAGFWIRTVAFLIDGIILTAVAAFLHFILRLIMGGAGADAGSIRLVSNLAAFVCSMAYWCGFWISRWHASPGKALCGLRVIARDGGPLSFPRALGRFFALIISFALAGIGVLMVAVTPRKQGLHDYLARTYVVKL